LAPWVQRVAEMLSAPGVREALVFFNNCHEDKATSNAKTFEKMLERALPPGSVHKAMPLEPELPWD
jgi:uncharacterized protein YecE (DUF72 family)